jgi:ribosomal protein L11 methyltransferase
LNFSQLAQFVNHYMDYIEVHFQVEPQTTGTEILIAFLSQIGYESFMETDEGLTAYIQASEFQMSDLNELQQTISADYKFTFVSHFIKNQNWNEVWESNFNPVLIGNQVFVRAPFHKGNSSVKYEIVIEPKMSFGTAHHETTSMMMELMLEQKFSGCSVLDIGCGTGILAIFSELLGAASIMAVDNDIWAFENALENIRKNKCRKISVFMGNGGLLNKVNFDVILANINRNVLLEDMNVYAEHLKSEGFLLLSGFYADDYEVISQSVKSCGFIPDKKNIKNSWVAARFIKSTL